MTLGPDPGGAVRPQRDQWPWPRVEVDKVIYRARVLGATERAIELLLADLKARGVRRLVPYVEGIRDDDLTARLCELAQRAARVRGHADVGPQGWRDGHWFITPPRRPKRFKWRVDSGAAVGSRGGV